MMELMNKATQGEAKPKYEAATLPIEKIIPSPGNFYSMEGIEELADSILLARGVLQNIVVRSADADGRYMIISGHRRVAACRKLVEDGHAEFGEIAALIENEADENLRELMLIYTNSTSRILTDAEKMRQAQRAMEILKNLKAEGKFEGRIRDAVARMLDTTGAQLARYAAIANNLTNPELKEAFEGGRLGVSAAYEASGLSEKGQNQIAEKLQEGGAVSIQDVKEVKEAERPAEKKNEATPKEHTEYLNTINPIWITTVKNGSTYGGVVGYGKAGEKTIEINLGSYPNKSSVKRAALEKIWREAPEEIVADILKAGYLENWGMPDRFKKEKPIEGKTVPEEDAMNEPPILPEIYALTTIISDLEALQEDYLGAAERHVAMGGDHAGKVNLETTAHHLQILINRTKSDLAFWKQKQKMKQVQE